MQAVQAEGLCVFCIRREIEFFQFGVGQDMASEGENHGRL
ncbi:hypothetical protein GCM10022279_33250 [Comamonas faecalis]|uniref:Uncharacterized protein n=1 Tax=Comamonas faecalis TaxID=1387849 RepID=A0ABP7S4R6_9BURK